MTYLQTPYADNSGFLLYAEPELSMDSENEHVASPASTGGSWTVGRYLTENKTPFLLYPVIGSASPGIVAPFPSPPFQRAESPSYTNPSSTCSSGLSPPGETDYCHIYSPPTPSDLPLMPQYESYPQVYEYTGLADGCVNLGDVNPIQDLPNNYLDSSLQTFDSHLRTCSMSSDGSNTSSKAWSDEEIFQQPRCLSPETPDMKEEIRLPRGLENHYTPEEDETEKVTDAGSPCLKRDTDECENEDDYRPYEKPKDGSPKSTHNTTNHKRRSVSESFVVVKRPKTTMKEPPTVPSASKPPIQGTKGGQYHCPDCMKSFKDQIGLDNHVKKRHTRPFTCIFEFAGCRSTFPSKNEWKRHCASQHIVLQYWVCQQDGCAQVSNKPRTPKKSSGPARRRSNCPGHSAEHPSALPNGTIFNRKDLYTQHLRRMHVPTHLKNKVKSKTPVPEWEEQQRAYQDEAIRTRCYLPEHMTCPAPNCNVQFEGRNAWDDRMEHVAKHLEKAAGGMEPPVAFGGETDESLISWATSPEIGILRRDDGGGWALQNPLKLNSCAALPAAESNEDDDAEGEEVDE
ncbi:hypothetical protein F4861DRAFT_530032 [Xylaria intraflava]|nr:hypothetical protein F4861DRAFT_530032 [Xylaria intraflava]